MAVTAGVSWLWVMTQWAAPVGVPAGMEERRRWPSTPADPRTQHGGRRRVGGGESGGDRRAARRQRRCRRTCRRGRSTADGGGADDDDGADDGGGRGRADGWATAQIPPRGGGYRGVAVGAGGRMGARPPRSPPVGGGAEGWRVVRAGRRVGDRPDPPPWGRGAEGCRSATVAPKRAGLQPTVLIGGAPQALKSKGVGARSLVRILNTRQDAEPPPHDILVVSQWIDWRVTLKRPVAGSRQPGQARIRNKPCGQGPLGTAL